MVVSERIAAHRPRAERASMKRLIVILLLTAPVFAATIRNDDSCDIGLYPAATLLLPYFEVDTTFGRGETTIVTITNVSSVPQAARVTLWTDYAYPVLSFNLYLTGYDVQSINLVDVIRDGIIGGGSSATGELSRDENPRLAEDTCATLPARIPAPVLARVQSALRTGRALAAGPHGECNTAGSVHQYTTVGYATIDVVGACTGSLPIDRDYFTHEIRFDNVLAGDYVQAGGHEDFAQANPLVHIRAIPEGGEASTRRKTNLPRTFYSRLQRGPNETLDGRQPLPATFAARWLDGGGLGFRTFYKIWREPRTSATTPCSHYPGANMMAYEVVAFDEEENPEVIEPALVVFPINNVPVLGAATRAHVGDQRLLPPVTTGANGGWMYFNFHNRTHPSIASQNWIVVSMEAEDRYSADFDAVSLGNGCTPVRPLTERTWNTPPGAPPIGPAPNVNR
jgi:hypothetical protein